MLVRFIGAPISGKTTVAAQVFAQLKLSGQPNVEFVVEQARLFIAERKGEYLKGCEIPPLTDEDQMTIMRKQMQVENVMEYSVGYDGIVITDSSAYNSLWYMSDAARAKALDDLFVWAHLESYKDPHNLLFLCAPLPMMVPVDRLRLHTPQESKNVHDMIMALVHSEDPEGTRHVALQVAHDVAIPLAGPNNVRVNEVLQKIHGKLTE
jgi:predicted ATPase